MRLHRELERRARDEGRTLTSYVQAILEREVAKPPAAEVFARIATRAPVEIHPTAAEILREERDRRSAP
jgi:lipid-binding SYLF domain-containing protein